MKSIGILLVAWIVVGILLSVQAGAATIVPVDYRDASYPGYVGWAASSLTWWHQGGAPLGPTTPNDSPTIPGVKNHQIPQFKTTVAPVSLVNSYDRKLTAADLESWGTTPPAYGSIYGQHDLGEYQDLTAATDYYFPPETVGQPLNIHGDIPSGLIFKDVSNEMLVQFFSSDKNDGWIQILVNDVKIGSFDTWCEGWWYFRITGMDPTKANKVELRTVWDATDNTSIASAHYNTLDLSPTSENWLHKLPGDAGYPKPDDFHIFFVAYNVVPEPATMGMLFSGLAAGLALLRRKALGK